jgi:type IV secretion system protein VirB8
VTAVADERDLRVTKAEERAYYQAAQAWDDDRVSRTRRSERTAWIVAGASAALVAVLGLALALLMPLKRVETQLVRVDASTGIVDNVVRLRDAELAADEVMNKYFLRKYVVLRKSYTRQQLQANYDQLVLFTDAKLRPLLRQEFHMSAPTSPFARYGELGTAEVRVKNVSFIAPNIAQVRYFVTERKANVETQVHEIATLEFRYVAAPASEESRAVNPLGFQVQSFRADPEAFAQAAEAAAR